MIKMYRKRNILLSPDAAKSRGKIRPDFSYKMLCPRRIYTEKNEKRRQPFLPLSPSGTAFLYPLFMYSLFMSGFVFLSCTVTPVRS